MLAKEPSERPTACQEAGGVLKLWEKSCGGPRRYVDDGKSGSWARNKFAMLGKRGSTCGWAPELADCLLLHSDALYKVFRLTTIIVVNTWVTGWPRGGALHGG